MHYKYFYVVLQNLANQTHDLNLILLKIKDHQLHFD